MGLTGIFRRDPERQTGRDRRELRDHLDELDGLFEDGLEALGGLIDSSPPGDLDRDEIWQRAARLSSVEDEIRLVERGITERLTRDQLAELARDQAAGAGGGGQPPG